LPSTGSSSSLLSLLEFALELGTVLTRPLLDLVWPGARGGRVLLLLENRLFLEYCRRNGEDFAVLLLFVAEGRRLVR